MKTRKHLFVYLYHFVFLLLFGSNVSRIDYEEIQIIDIANMIGVIAMLSLAANALINPYFIMIDGDEVKVAKYFFGYHRFNKSDIESIEEAEGYSLKIYINLKNGKRMTISSMDISKKNRMTLLNFLKNNSNYRKH